jgi:hypothetical protein
MAQNMSVRAEALLGLYSVYAMHPDAVLLLCRSSASRFAWGQESLLLSSKP